MSWSQAHQVMHSPPPTPPGHYLLQDTEDLTHILNVYCRHLADCNLSQQESKEGIFVMTVNSVDLSSVCASLMDISLQLLASVKSLERSLTQVGFSFRAFDSFHQ